MYSDNRSEILKKKNDKKYISKKKLISGIFYQQPQKVRWTRIQGLYQWLHDHRLFQQSYSIQTVHKVPQLNN